LVGFGHDKLCQGRFTRGRYPGNANQQAAIWGDAKLVC
jgi:hypothetical protein